MPRMFERFRRWWKGPNIVCCKSSDGDDKSAVYPEAFARMTSHIRKAMQGVPGLSDAGRYEIECATEAAYLEGFVTKWFGQRCPKFEETCEVCRRWKLFDELTKSPWEDDE